MPPNDPTFDLQPGQQQDPPSQLVRQLKHLNLKTNAPQSFVDALNLLNTIAGSNYSKRTQPYNSNLSTTQADPIKNLLPALNTTSENTHQTNNTPQAVYQKVNQKQTTFNQYLLPADVVSFLYDLLVEFVDFYQEELSKPGLKELGKQVFNLKDNIFKSYLSQWTNDSITHSQELSLAEKKFKTRQISEELISAINMILDAQAAISLESQELVAETGQESAEIADSLETAASVVAQEEGLDETAAAETSEQSQPEAAPPTDAQEFNTALKLFSTSFSAIALSSIFRTLNRDLQQEPISFHNLNPELQQLLVSQLSVQVEQIILSLSSQELKALRENASQAAGVRLKILRQAHQYAINYPPLRFLMQQAVNEHFQSTESPLTNEDRQQLENQIQQTPHTTSAIRLELVAESGAELTEEQQKQLSTLSNYPMLPAAGFRELFNQEIERVLGEKLDQTQLNIGRRNLDSTLTSLTITDPKISSQFVDFFNYARLRTFFGDAISREQFEAHQASLKILFKQYWLHHRTELNTQFPELEKLSHMSPDLSAMNEEQIDERLKAATRLRSESSLSTNSIRAWSGKKPDEKEGGLTKEESQKIQQNKALLWSILGEKEKKLYLIQAGYSQDVFEFTQSHQQEKKFSYDDLLKQLNHDIDYFTLVRASIIHEQALEATKIQRQKQVSFIKRALRVGLAQQATAYAQNLAVLQSSHFLTPNQPFSIEGYPDLQQIGAAGADPSNTSNYQAPGLSQAKAITNSLAAKGIDAGITYATGGAYQAIPAPIRKFINQKLAKKIAPIFKFLAGTATVVGSLLAALAHKIFTLLKSLSVIGASSAVGYLFLGPAGAMIGLTASSLWVGGKQLFNISGASADAAGIGVKNVASDLAGLAREEIGLGSRTPATRASTATEAAAATEATGIGTLITPASASVVGAVGLTVAATALTLSQIASSFLINPEMDHLQMAGVSFFADVIKTATIVNEGSGCAGRSSCPEPNFPIEVEYSITIAPKNNNIITVTNITDSSSFSYNHDAYQDEGRTTPQAQTFTKSTEELGAESLVGQQITEPITFTYQETISDQNNHSLIRNVVTVEFNYSGYEDSGSDSAKGSASIAIGDAPSGILCWPVTGRISQGPWETFSHSRVDAYDVVPFKDDSSDWNIYAPINGELCAGLWGVPGHGLFDSIYGVNVSIKTAVNGEEYVLVFGHLHTGTARVQDRSCRPVSQGEIIGLIGNTGYSGGPHLHLEKRGSGSTTLTELMTNSIGAQPLPRGAHVFSCVVQ